MAGKNKKFDDSANVDLDKRLQEMNKRLGRDEKSIEEANAVKPDRSGYGSAFRLSSEFISAILVGTAIGYGIDWLAGTSPWAMIVFLLLGFVAGVMNVLRAAGEMTGPVDLGRTDPQDGAKKEE